ncbi:hypothetical protein [Chryseobacterium gambrini]|uniref:hypothetical protein n=1 Tax=Chryseobacterium gambrini TaxID=373672 RepID=UPI003D152C9A
MNDSGSLKKAEAIASFKIIYQQNRNEKKRILEEKPTVLSVWKQKLKNELDQEGSGKT